MKRQYFVVNMPDMQTGGHYVTPAILLHDVLQATRAGYPEPLIYRRNPNALAEKYERVTLDDVRKDGKL